MYVPDVCIDADAPEYVLHPIRGYSGILAVFDIDDRCIGWMHIDVTGCKSVQEWMTIKRYRYTGGGTQ